MCYGGPVTLQLTFIDTQLSPKMKFLISIHITQIFTVIGKAPQSPNSGQPIKCRVHQQSDICVATNLASEIFETSQSPTENSTIFKTSQHNTEPASKRELWNIKIEARNNTSIVANYKHRQFSSSTSSKYPTLIIGDNGTSLEFELENCNCSRKLSNFRHVSCM